MATITRTAVRLGKRSFFIIMFIVYTNLYMFFFSTTNDVDLRDMNGQDHIVLADMGCRNTVFNAQAQSGAEVSKSIHDSPDFKI